MCGDEPRHFLFGMASAFDLGDTLTHLDIRKILNQTDEEVIASEKVVGDDMRTALGSEKDISHRHR